MTKRILAVDPSWSIEELLARLRAAPPSDGRPRKTFDEIATEQGVGPYRANLDHISPDERTPEERRREEEAWKAWEEERGIER